MLSDQNGLKVPLGVAVAPQAYWSMLADPLAFGGGHQADRHIGPTKGGFGTTTPQPHRRFHSGPRNTSGIPVGPIMPKDCWGVTLLEASDLQIRTQRPVSGIVGSAHGPNSFLFNASPWYSAVSIGLRVGNSDSVYREEPSTWPEIDLAFGPHRAVTEADPQSLGLPLETLSVAYEDRHVLCLPYDQGLCQCRMLCEQHSLRQSCASALANPTKGGWARAPPPGSGRDHLLAQSLIRFWQEFMLCVLMGDGAWGFGLLLRILSRFSLCLLRFCAEGHLTALVIVTTAVALQWLSLLFFFILFSPLIAISVLYWFYVYAIKGSIALWVRGIAWASPSTDIAIPDDVFCFMGDSDRATQVMAVATLFRVVVDSGCSRSIICHEHAFVPGTLDLSKRPRIWGFNGSCTLASGVGTARVPFKDPSSGDMREIIVEDALFCPDLKINLLSVNQMRKTRSDGTKGYHVDYQEEPLPVIVELRGQWSFELEQIGNLNYINHAFDGVTVDLGQVQAEHENALAAIGAVFRDQKYGDALCLKAASNELVHARAIHRNHNRLAKLKTKGLATGLDGITSSKAPTDERCPICAETKATRAHISTSGSRRPTTHPFEVVHTDLMSVREPDITGRNRYAVNFVDQHTGAVFVYLLRNKTEVPKAFETFYEDIVLKHGFKIRQLRSDNGSEFKNKKLRRILAHLKIRYRYTPAYSPEYNGIAERSFRTLMNDARAQLRTSNLPASFWGAAVVNAARVGNMVGSDNHEITPHQAVYGELPDFSHIRAFGSPSYIHTDDREHARTKLDPPGREAIYIGIDPESNSWIFWDLVRSKIVRSAHARIFERALKVKSQRPAADGNEQWFFGREERVRGYRQPVAATASWGDDPQDGNMVNVDENDFVDLHSDNEDDGGVNPNIDPQVEVDAAASEQQGTESDSSSTTSSAPSSPASPVIHPEPTAVISEPKQCSLVPQVNMTQEMIGDAAALCYLLHEDISVLFSQAVTAASLQLGEPKNYKQAVSGTDAHIWRESMQEELDSHRKCGTYVPVTLPKGVKVVPLQWVYKIKQNEKGEPIRAKSRLVARGDMCVAGVHFEAIHAPVVHFATSRMFLGLTCQRGWKVHQMDVGTAFVNAELDRDDIYFQLPPGGIPGVPDRDEHGNRIGLHAKKALYGLPQAPRLWNRKFTKWLRERGFEQSQKDPCYFVKRMGGEEVHMIVYVDDIAFAGSDPTLVQMVKDDLNESFEMKDMGELKWFLGSEIVQDVENGTTVIHQAKYINDLIEQFESLPQIDVIPVKSTPSPTQVPSLADLPDKETAARKFWWRPYYRSLVGSLLYAQCCSRPEISNEVRLLSQCLENPSEEHWKLGLHVLGYLKSNPQHGIQFTRNDNANIANRLFLYVDATWADDEFDRKSTSGMCLHFNGGPVIWKSKKQPIIAQSSCESEIIAATYGANEAVFVKQLLEEIGVDTPSIRVYEDNTGATAIANNPGKLRQRSRHFELRFLKVQEYVTRRICNMVQVPTSYQLADIFTKCTQGKTFSKLSEMVCGYTSFDHNRYVDTAL